MSEPPTVPASASGDAPVAPDAPPPAKRPRKPRAKKESDAASSDFRVPTLLATLEAYHGRAPVCRELMLDLLMSAARVDIELLLNAMYSDE